MSIKLPQTVLFDNENIIWLEFWDSIQVTYFSLFFFFIIIFIIFPAAAKAKKRNEHPYLRAMLRPSAPGKLESTLSSPYRTKNKKRAQSGGDPGFSVEQRRKQCLFGNGKVSRLGIISSIQGRAFKVRRLGDFRSSFVLFCVFCIYSKTRGEKKTKKLEENEEERMS